VGRIHRTRFLLISVTVLGLSYWVLFLFGLSYLQIFLVGAIISFAYGGLWAVQPAIVSDLFGPRDYGFKYACSMLAAAFGVLLFSRLLAAHVYDTVAESRGEAPQCFSPSCFSSSFLLTGACAVPALLLGFWLCSRTNWIYEELACDGGSQCQSDCGSSESGSGVHEVRVEASVTPEGLGVEASVTPECLAQEEP